MYTEKELCHLQIVRVSDKFNDSQLSYTYSAQWQLVQLCAYTYILCYWYAVDEVLQVYWQLAHSNVLFNPPSQFSRLDTP